MNKQEEKEIKQAIIQKKKQGVPEKSIMKFLKISGYPLRFLEEVNLELEKGKKPEEEARLMPKVIALLFAVSALIELIYFVNLTPDSMSMKGASFGVMVFVVFFTFISFSVSYGLFKERNWAANIAVIMIILRGAMMAYLSFKEHVFFLFIIVLDMVLLAVVLSVKPGFDSSKLHREREQMMQEVEDHGSGKNKKESWQS